VANVVCPGANTGAVWLTGTSSMVAEAAHSWADAGNEIFLMTAERRAARPPDAEHPTGYGREAYVWSMMAALGLFLAGAAVSIMHGIQELLDPEPASNFAIAYGVFAVAFVLEGVSFLQAYRQVRQGGRGAKPDLVQQALNTSDTPPRSED